MGIVGGDRYSGDTQFLQSVDVRFAMTGTADNGLSFGATVDLDDSQDTAVLGRDTVDSTTFSDFTVFISGELGTLTMGDTDGALDWAMQEVNIGSPGSIDDSETEHAGFNGNSGLDGWYDGQVLRYDYSFGDFSVAVSATQDDNSSGFGLGFDSDDVINGLAPLPAANNADVTADPIWALGARYNGAFAGGTFGVGLGYQFTNDGLDQLAGTAAAGVDFTESDETATIWGLSASVSLDNGFSAAVNYSSISLDLSEAVATGLAAVPDGELGDAFELDGSHFGIGASYTFDAITIHANYGQYDWGSEANAVGINDASGYGLAAAYDFGGGLSAHLGYGYSDVDGGDDSDSVSFGLAMSF
jgi:outer membrane protein OmpU